MLMGRGPAPELVLGTTFRFGHVAYVVDYLPPPQDSLFHAVLHSGLLPHIFLVHDLRRLMYNFAQGPGRPIAAQLMTLLSKSSLVAFDDYIKRLLIPGAETDHFDVVLLALFSKINLIILQRSLTGFSAFNVLQFVAREPRLNPTAALLSPDRELYLFQAPSPHSSMGASSYFVSLRRELIAAKAVAATDPNLTRSALDPSAPTTESYPLQARIVQNRSDEAVTRARVSSGKADPGAHRRRGPASSARPVTKRPRSEKSLFGSDIGSDLRLLIGRTAFSVHRNRLMDQCGCFRDFFRSECFVQLTRNRKWNGRDLIVKLPELGAVPWTDAERVEDPAAVFQAFLELVYNVTSIASMTTWLLVRIVVVAVKCDCERVVRLCDAELARRSLALSPNLLAFSQRYHLPLLRTALLSLLDAQILDSFQLIGQLSVNDITDYLTQAARPTPVTLLTVALIYVCGLDARNQIRKRGDFYEIARHQSSCKTWVELCARQCRDTGELADLYALVRKTRLVLADGRFDDITLRDAVMMSAPRSANSTNSRYQAAAETTPGAV